MGDVGAPKPGRAGAETCAPVGAETTTCAKRMLFDVASNAIEILRGESNENKFIGLSIRLIPTDNIARE